MSDDDRELGALLSSPPPADDQEPVDAEPQPVGQAEDGDPAPGPKRLECHCGCPYGDHEPEPPHACRHVIDMGDGEARECDCEGYRARPLTPEEWAGELDQLYGPRIQATIPLLQERFGVSAGVALGMAVDLITSEAMCQGLGAASDALRGINYLLAGAVQIQQMQAQAGQQMMGHQLINQGRGGGKRRRRR